MKIVITVKDWKPEHTKEIVNSIRGFVKSMGRRFGFSFEIEQEVKGYGKIQGRI